MQVHVAPKRGAQRLPRLVNDAVNAFGGPTQPAAFPHASASYTSPYDDAQRPIDGENFYLDIPNTRWTSYLSPNPTDWWSVDFGELRPVSDVRIYFYNDNGGVKPPVSYQLQYLTATGEWLDIPNQLRDPVAPVGNDLNRITFGRSSCGEAEPWSIPSYWT